MKKFLLEEYIKYKHVDPLRFLKKIKDDNLNFADVSFKNEEIYFLERLFKNANWKDINDIRKKFINFFSSTNLYLKYIEYPTNKEEELTNKDFFEKINLIISKINDRFLQDCFYENAETKRVFETFLRAGSDIPARSIKKNATYQQQDSPGMFRGHNIYSTINNNEIDWNIEEETDSFTGDYMIRVYIKYIEDGVTVKKSVITKSFVTKEELDAWKSSELCNIIRKYEGFYNNKENKNYINSYWK